MTIVSSFSEPRACAKLEIKNTDIYFGSENGAICLLPMDTLVNSGGPFHLTPRKAHS